VYWRDTRGFEFASSSAALLTSVDRIEMDRNPVSLAKTTRPSLSGILPRDRLFRLLDQARKGSICWVTGPPGAGKTTLVASYLDFNKLPCLWYQLDEGDADIATFFYYLARAAAQYEKGENDPLPALTREYQADPSIFTRRYFQALFQRLGAPFVVVFDGYHEVPPQAGFHEVMRDALSEIPPGMCVVLISRSDPPAAMARLRANRAIEVIGWNELRLTREESDAFVKLRGGQLSDQALLDIYKKTQGWAAGLILMLEGATSDGAIADTPDLATPQLIFDYLAGEIFQKSDKRTQDLLIKTAFLPQMTARMAQDVAGESSAGQILAELSRNNYFVTLKQAKPEPVYQYHPLLKEFLLSRARETLAESTYKELQHLSAQLLINAGQTEDAVSLLRDSRDWEQMARVIEQHAVSMLNQGRGETLADWLESIPRESLQQNPWMLYWLGACHVPSAPREGRLFYEQAYELFRSRDKPDLKGLLLSCSGVMNSIMYELDDFALLDRWIAKVEELSRGHGAFPEPSIEARVTCSMFMSMIMRQPHHPDLESWVQRALNLSPNVKDPNQRIYIESLVAISIVWVGHFQKTDELLSSIRQLAQSPQVTPFSLILLKNVEAMYYMMTADHKQCLKTVREGLEIGQANGISVWSYHLLAYGALGALGAGDLDAAARLLKQMDTHPERVGRFGLCLYHYCSAWEAMLKQDTVRAFHHQKMALKMSIEVGAPYFEVISRIGLGQILLECGDKAKVAIHLEQIHDLTRNIKNHHLEFMGLLSFAQMALEHGRPRPGFKALRYALSLGRQYGYMHVFWWQPAAMSRLCCYALEENIEVDYVKKLIRTRKLPPDTKSSELDNWPWGFKIFTLGQFKLLKDDAPIELSGKAQHRPMDFLKVLVAHGGKGVTEEHFTDALWPRIDGDSAHRSFTTTLHRLRKLLGEDKAVVLREGRVKLDERYCWLDTWALEEVQTTIDELFKAPHQRIDGDKVAWLEQKLLTLYAGPFMGNEAEQPWYITTRERLRNKFIRSMSEIGRYWEQAGEWDKAIGCYQRSLEADNQAEGFYRNLMICYEQLGRRAEALETYNRCRKTLHGVHGVEPSSETKAVYEKLMQQN